MNLVKSVAIEKLQIEEKKQKQKANEEKAFEEAGKLPVAEVWRRGLREVMRGDGKGTKTVPYDQLPDVVSFAKLLNLPTVSGLSLEEVAKPQPKKKKGHKPKNGLTPGGGRGRRRHKTQRKGKERARARAKENQNRRKLPKTRPPAKAVGKGKVLARARTSPRARVERRAKVAKVAAKVRNEIPCLAERKERAAQHHRCEGQG